MNMALAFSSNHSSELHKLHVF